MAVLNCGKPVQVRAGAVPVQELGREVAAALTEAMNARAEILESICFNLVKSNK